jgi:hypothetical protein
MSEALKEIARLTLPPPGGCARPNCPECHIHRLAIDAILTAPEDTP